MLYNEMGKYYMKKRKLGFDIDGTITCPAAIVPFLNEAFQLQLTLDDLTDYDLLKVVDIPDKEFTDWYDKKRGRHLHIVSISHGGKRIIIRMGKTARINFHQRTGRKRVRGD